MKIRIAVAICSPIPGFPHYRVTSGGEVLSSQPWRGTDSRTLAPRPNSHGYLRVRLYHEGRSASPFVHKLVAKAFMPARPTPSHCIRHLNGNQNDNRVENLAWGTSKENAADRERHGRTARGEAIQTAKLSAEDVLSIRSRLTTRETQQGLATEFGVSRTTIQAVAYRKSWKHLPSPEQEVKGEVSDD